MSEGVVGERGDIDPAPGPEPGGAAHAADAADQAATRPRGLLSRLLLPLKLGLAAALFAWLWRRGALDLGALRGALGRWDLLCAALGLGAVNLTASAVRWQLLLRGEGIDLPLSLAVRLTWIGHFWNMVFPGAVSGDAVKMYYVGAEVPARREEAWTTVLADRVIGLAALVALSTLATLASLEQVLARPELRRTFVTMLALLAVMAGGGAALALGVGRRTPLADGLRARLPFAQSARRGYHALLRLGRRPRVVLVAFTISFVAHGSAVFVAYLLGQAVGEASLAPRQYGVVVPVALFSNAIPITPGGIGVGEQVLGRLFAWSGGLEAKGVAIMLLFRLQFFALAAVGAVLYALHRRPAAAPTAKSPVPPGLPS